MPIRSGWSSSAERDAARSIERTCASGADSVSLRRAVLRHAARLIPAEVYFFNTLDPETGLVTHGLGEGAPSDLVRRYYGAVYPEGEAERVVDLARSGEVVAQEPGDELRRLFASAGLRRELRAAFSVRDEPWGLWCAVRECGGPPFGDRERAFLRRIAPPVARALRVAGLRDVAEASTDATSEVPGVLVVDARGRVAQRTPAAAAQLADLADAGRADAELPSVISGLLARQRIACARGTAWRPEIRARGHSGRWYTVRVALTEPDADGRSNAIVLIAPLGPRDVAPLLATLYGLTPREREVVALVARGHATKQIAARLGISSYTVQDHLDHASEKVGVRGRRALLARLFFDGYAPRLGRRA